MKTQRSGFVLFDVACGFPRSVDELAYKRCERASDAMRCDGGEQLRIDCGSKDVKHSSCLIKLLVTTRREATAPVRNWTSLGGRLLLNASAQPCASACIIASS